MATTLRWRPPRYDRQEAAKKYVPTLLPQLVLHLDSEDSRLRGAACCGIGAVAEHGGKLLTRAAATEVSRKLMALLQASSGEWPKLFCTFTLASQSTSNVLKASSIAANARLPN